MSENVPPHGSPKPQLDSNASKPNGGGQPKSGDGFVEKIKELPTAVKILVPAVLIMLLLSCCCCMAFTPFLSGGGGGSDSGWGSSTDEEWRECHATTTIII